MAIYSAYPVIHGDIEKLNEKSNFQNYDAHFIPVVPNNPTNPHENVYHPCQSQQKLHYTQVVIFESSPCLPRYLVELQSNFIQIPANTPGEIEYQKDNKLLFCLSI